MTKLTPTVEKKMTQEIENLLSSNKTIIKEDKDK